MLQNAIRTRWWVLLVLGTLVCGCRRSAAPETTSQTREPEPIHPQLIVVREQTWPTLVRTQGTLVADEATMVGARVAGRVAEVHVELGDRVEAGAPLVSLEREEFELEVAAAEARLGQARAAVGVASQESIDSVDPNNSPPVREAKAVWDDAQQQVKRLRQLEGSRAISAAEMDAANSAAAVAEARHASAINSVREKIALAHVAEAELALARQRLADAVVFAPYAGVIRLRSVAPGTFVQTGDPLVELVRNAVLRYQASVPEKHARKIAIGRRVMLRVEGRSESLPAEVSRISPTLDMSNRSLMFEADVANPDGTLRSGQFAEATVELDTQATALAVPWSAVVQFAGVEKVWRVEAGRAVEVAVQLGRRQGDFVEVLGGIAAGDVVLVNGNEGAAAPVASAPPPEPSPHSVSEQPSDSPSDRSGS